MSFHIERERERGLIGEADTLDKKGDLFHVAIFFLLPLRRLMSPPEDALFSRKSRFSGRCEGPLHGIAFQGSDTNKLHKI